ncbi:LytR/AlgR family response regulator transcription factor [Mucilaginibacter celer]|uniref:Response regulator n=1 Tax=Mucilaginibacter celer TaxID=2305508 RepID=A0A494VXZ2_9SPHI|nr:LytTR family DNA-binding domain-containing protein [Mucilaginibacter celer]AYL96188.1 response regulator [Mucilaginibacter celer]
MKLNCLIIDDEPIARKLLQEYIEETDFMVLVDAVENPLKATSIINNNDIDLIFLDVNMPKMSGFQFLRSTTNLPMVIMTTAYGQYALEGFEMAVVDYLVKPFPLERFLKASQKALELKMLRQKQHPADKNEADHFYVKCDGKIERVLYNELVYIEAMANYVTLYTLHKKLVVYLTVKGIEEKLPAEKFIQVHKSYIVNADLINNIEGNMINVNGTRISIGLSFYDEVMDKLLKGKLFKR